MFTLPSWIPSSPAWLNRPRAPLTRSAGHQPRDRVHLPRPTPITPAGHAAAGAGCRWRFAALRAAGALWAILFSICELADELEQHFGIVAVGLFAIARGTVAKIGRIHSARP